MTVVGLLFYYPYEVLALPRVPVPVADLVTFEAKTLVGCRPGFTPS